MDPYKLFPVEASFQRGKRFAYQVGFAADVQSGIVSQSLDPINIRGLDKSKLVSPAHGETPDETSIVGFSAAARSP